MLKGMSERNTTQTRFGTQNRKQLAKGDKQITMHYNDRTDIFFKFDLFCDEGTALFRLAGAFKPHAENQTLGIGRLSELPTPSSHHIPKKCRSVRHITKCLAKPK